MTTAKKKAAHPNRMPFEGILTHVDEPSDKAPSGSRGHRVVLTREAAEEALESLEGMAIDFKADWDGHDARQKCGVITKAWLEGTELHVSGHVYCRDFPDVADFLRSRKKEMGMSYELADAHVENMRSDVWRLTQVIFTGAAVLLKNKAAYGKSSFNITAAAAVRRFNGKISFIDHHVPTGAAKIIERRRSKANAHAGAERRVD